MLLLLQQRLFPANLGSQDGDIISEGSLQPKKGKKDM
jgi:hypothetical protein